MSIAVAALFVVVTDAFIVPTAGRPELALQVKCWGFRPLCVFVSYVYVSMLGIGSLTLIEKAGKNGGGIYVCLPHKCGVSPPLLSLSLTALVPLSPTISLSGQDQHQGRLGQPQGGNDG